MGILKARLILAASLVVTLAACERTKDKTPEPIQQIPPQEEPVQPAPDEVTPVTTPQTSPSDEKQVEEKQTEEKQAGVNTDEVTPDLGAPVVETPVGSSVEGSKVEGSKVDKPVAVNPQLLRERDAIVASLNARALYLYEHHNWQIVIMPLNPEKILPTVAEYQWYKIQPPNQKAIAKELKQQIAEGESLNALAAEGLSVSGLSVVQTTIDFSKLYLTGVEAEIAKREKEEAEAGASAH